MNSKFRQLVYLFFLQIQSQLFSQMCCKQQKEPQKLWHNSQITNLAAFLPGLFQKKVTNLNPSQYISALQTDYLNQPVLQLIKKSHLVVNISQNHTLSELRARDHVNQSLKHIRYCFVSVRPNFPSRILNRSLVLYAARGRKLKPSVITSSSRSIAVVLLDEVYNEESKRTHRRNLIHEP